MVLIQLLWACTIGKQPITTVKSHDVFIVSSLDKLDNRESSPIPSSLHDKLISTMQKRGIQPKSLQHESRYAELRDSEQRIKIFTERPLLLVETKAQFFFLPDSAEPLRWESSSM